MNILEFDETSSYCLISVLKEFIIKMKFHQYDKISYDKRFFVMRKKINHYDENRHCDKIHLYDENL